MNDYDLDRDERNNIIHQLNQAVISGDTREIKRILTDYKHENITLERIECDTLEKCTFTEKLLETLLEYDLPFYYLDTLEYPMLLSIYGRNSC